MFKAPPRLQRLVLPPVDQDVPIKHSLGLSAALHLLIVLFAIFGLPILMPDPPEISEPVVVDAEIGDKTAAPPKQIQAPKPVEKPEPPKQDAPPVKPPEPEPPRPPEPKPDPKPVPPPTPQPAPPPPPKPVEVPKPPPPTPKPAPPDETVPGPKPKPPEPKKDTFDDMMKNTLKPKPKDEFDQMMSNSLKPDPKAKPPKDQSDPLDSALKNMDKSRPPPPSLPQGQTSAANQTVNSSLSDLAAQPTASEKDYIKAQIIKCWNFDAGQRDADKMRFDVRVAILPDGTVTRSDLVGSVPAAWQAAADSAVRAPRICSPLRVPPSRPDLFKRFPDFTLTFDPRSMVR